MEVLLLVRVVDVCEVVVIVVDDGAVERACELDIADDEGKLDEIIA